MAVLLTLVTGLLGGVIAFSINLPVPWLIGSMILVFLGNKLMRPPSKPLFRWMRVLLGVTIGSTVASDLSGQTSLLVVTSFGSIIFVLTTTFIGYHFFGRLPNFSSTDRFTSALPGGLTFILSIADNLGKNFPKIALIHSVRLFVLVFCFTMFGYFVGPPQEDQSVFSAFSIEWSYNSWQLIVLIIGCGLLANFLKISGGHLIFPIIISALVYYYGIVDVPVPEIIKTIAMIVFGIQIGCKLSGGSIKEYQMQAHASFSFSVLIIAIALTMALFLAQFHSVDYFLIFLALAPGSIPEISLIAIALGFDVGFVAAVHTCRYLFIMCLGWLGVNFFNKQADLALPSQVQAQAPPQAIPIDKP